MDSYKTSLGYIEYDSSSYASIPPPSLNGGLYTGEKFQKNAPWATVPVIPDSGYMLYHNLKTANPPEKARTQYGNVRPGNNCFLLENIYYYDKNLYNFYCDGAAGSKGAPNKDQCKRGDPIQTKLQ